MTDVLEPVPFPVGVLSMRGDASRKVRDLCTSLHSELATLQSCIALFEHTAALARSMMERGRNPEAASAQSDRDKWIVHKWPFIAAREFLGAIYNFHWALKELTAEIEQNGEELPLAEPAGVKNALASFEKQFSKAILARHAASHRSEITNNFEKNAHKAALSSGPIIKPKGSSMIMSDSLVDRTYTTTRKGELLKVDVTWDTYKAVREIYENAISSVAKDEWPPFPDRTSRPR